MPKAMMATGAMIEDQTGGQPLNAAGTTLISMTHSVVASDARYITTDVANDCLVLKRTGWYLGWGGLFMFCTGTNNAYISCAANLLLGGVSIPSAFGPPARLVYAPSNSHLQLHNASIIAPTPFQVTTENSQLKLGSFRVDIFNSMSAVTATSNPGRSFVAAMYLGSGTE